MANAQPSVLARTRVNIAKSTSVDWVQIDEIRPNPKNARTHPRKQIRQIAASVSAFGFTNPILIDGENKVLAGHGRLAAAKLLGLTAVPVIRISHLSDAKKRAYVLADNRLAEKAGWDAEIRALELAELADLLPQEGLDVSLTGFEAAEVDLLLAEVANPESEPGTSMPPVPTVATARKGDLWQVGNA